MAISSALPERAKIPRFILAAPEWASKLGLILVLSVSQCLGQSSGPAERSQIYAQQRARDLITLGRLSEASAIYRHALVFNPTWSEGWWELGTLQYDAENFRQSQSAFSKYVTLKPLDGSGWAFKALSEFELKERMPALADFARADRLGIPPAQNLAAIARLHQLLLLNTMSDFAKAFRLEQELSSNDGCSSNLLVMGFGLTALRMTMLPSDVPESRADLVKATGQAACHAAISRVDQANAEFSELLQLFPNEPHLHYLFACFLLKEHPEKALALLKQELAISPAHVPAMTLLAIELVRLGQPQTALDLARRATLLSPRNAQAQFALGLAEINLNRTVEGARHLVSAYQLAPNDRRTLWALEGAYQKLNRHVDADRVRERLKQLDDAGVQH